MSDLDAQAVFVRHLDEAIVRYESDRVRHKKLALWLKVSTSALGAGATVLLGWQDPGVLATSLKNGALVLTSLVTLFAAYDAFFDPRKLWVRETFVFNSLRDLKRNWEIAYATGQTGPDSVMDYSDRFHKILTQSLNEWVTSKQSS
jgi:hypothetical protein